MRRFNFSLQRLLDYKHTVEDVLLVELAAIRAEHAREKAVLAEMTRAKDTFGRRIRKTLAAGDAEQIQRAYAYLLDLGRQITSQDAKVRQIAVRQDEKTSEVIAASKERKALDRLREQKQDEHQREDQRLAQVFLDDIASTRSRRSGCGAGGMS
jgi:flagellar protein FliJ